MVTPVPTSLVFKLAPGETIDGAVEVTNAPADPAVTGTVEGGGGAVSLMRLTSSRTIRIAYTESELQEIRPLSLQNRLRKEGRIELIEDGSAGPGQPLEVQRGGAVRADFEVTAGAGKGQVAVARIVLQGSVWGRSESIVAVATGSGTALPRIMPEKLQVMLAPGQTVTRSIMLLDAPVAATVAALIDAPKGRLKITRVVASRVDKVMLTEEEIAELPPHMREEARKNGQLIFVQTGEVGPASPIQVPAGGSLQIDVEITAPTGTAATLGFDGFVKVVADNWGRIEVPVYPIAQAMDVVLETDRFMLRQGGDPTEVNCDIKIRGGAAPTVTLRLGQPGDPWTFGPREVAVPLSTGGSHRVKLLIAATADAAVGDHPTYLLLDWFDSVGQMSVPVVLTVLPGYAQVLALHPKFSGNQGGVARVSVRLEAQSRKTVTFRATSLPPGIQMIAQSQTIFDPGFHNIDLAFTVEPNCRAEPDRPIAVDWDANDGFHRGTLFLSLTVLLTLQRATFSRPIVTPSGIALGGEATFTLANDGSGRFSGHMRATGFNSFRYRVMAAVRSSDGLVAIVDQATGKVHGTDSIGPRQSDWDAPTNTGALADFWPSVATASMSVSQAYEFTGIGGFVLDVAADLLDALAGLAVLAPIVPGGQALALLVIAGSELQELTGISVTGPGGLVGVFAAAGGAFIFGPGVILPVYIAGNVVGDALIRHRRASEAERAFAAQVFGPTLPFDRIWLTELTGAGGRQFVAPVTEGQILVNLGPAFDNPTGYQSPEYPEKGQVFIHELVHAWQVQHGKLDAAFLWRGTIGKVLSGEHYGYGPPGPAFSTFGIEGQASLVDGWFAGSTTNAPAGWPARAPMDINDPYFRYIFENIRLGQV